MVASNEPSKAVINSNPKTEKTKVPLTWREKMQKVIANITVEPIVAAYIMPSVLSNLATQNLNLEKACRVNMEYGEEICDALTRRETANYTMEEETIQKMVAHMVAWKTVIQSLFPCLLILFWGSWSDRHHRRKPCIMIPIVGEFLGTVGLILCVYFKDTPMEVAGLTEAIFPSLSGGWFVMLMGVFSYIADITTEEERTLRIGILNVCFSVGVPIGTALSGVLLKKIGFYGVFSISASLYVLSLVYGFFFLPEPRPRCIQPQEKTKSRSLLGDFFDKEHVVETFRVAFKKGENKRRARVILLMIVVMVVIGPIYGEMNVMYLFTRYRFNWNEVDFSVFNTFAVVTGLVGVLFCVGVLSHKLKIDDALIGVLSSTSKILSGFVYAFATLPWHMYVGAIVEIFNGTSFIAMRSMATKLVSKDELGKVNSLFGVAEALMPVVYAPMYSTLYAATIKVFPGAFYILGAAITVLAVIIFLWMYDFQRKQLRKQKSLDAEASKSVKEPTISTIDAMALASEAKGHLNGIVSNVLHEHICDLSCRPNGSTTCLNGNAVIGNGYDNKAYMPDLVEGADTKSEHNTHL
ncbi:tetracycline resistance protein, class A [Stomoxys calcitrans]|uniref:Major facilitator superfamily (MFS) profile domain-containing protein n=1 Tax=Stomoxys calcitrans TaxID=35570 RepID=A0A1I8PUY1_STOCA|nr:tetracycline resistance protein, class A [Stomoxys calcitrans]